MADYDEDNRCYYQQDLRRDLLTGFGYGLSWWFDFEPDDPTTWVFRRNDNTELIIGPDEVGEFWRCHGPRSFTGWKFKGDHDKPETWEFTTNTGVELAPGVFEINDHGDQHRKPLDKAAMDLSKAGWVYVEHSYAARPVPAHPARQIAWHDDNHQPSSSPTSELTSPPMAAWNDASEYSQRDEDIAFEERRPYDPNIETITQEPRLPAPVDRRRVPGAKDVYVEKTKKGLRFSRPKYPK